MFPRLPFTSGEATDETTSSHLTDAGTADDSTINFANDDADFWANAIEDDNFFSPMPFDASENGLFNGKFVPPPPRPPFLEDTVSSDGLTTCDLCSWALHERNSFSSLGDSIEASGELGWTLIVVSVISGALIGAILMIIVLRCRRLKPTNSNGNRPVPWWYRSTRSNNGTNTGTRGSIAAAKHHADSIRGPHNNSGVWTWLTNRRPPTAPDLGSTTHHQSPAENHYTHMDDAYSPVGVSGEALYAELDRESINSNNPSYQNTAYSQCGEMADQDGIPMVSSAPSSAYYSDLSTTAVPTERAYEVVGLTVMSSPLPNWNDGGNHSSSDTESNLQNTGLHLGRRHRLSAINESATIPSDYV